MWWYRLWTFEKKYTIPVSVSFSVRKGPSLECPPPWWMTLFTPWPSVIIELNLLWGKLEKSKWEEHVFKWKVPHETDTRWCIWVCQYHTCYLANCQVHNNLLKFICNMVECSGSLVNVDLGSWEDYKNHLYSAEFKDIKKKYSLWDLKWIRKKESYFFRWYNVTRDYHP